MLNGKKMAVLSWKVSIRNTSTNPATLLVVSCLNSKGEVIAKDDRRVNVAPGATLDQAGVTDIAVDTMEAMKSMTAQLAVE